MTTEELEARELKSKLDLAWQQVQAFMELLENKGYDVTCYAPRCHKGDPDNGFFIADEEVKVTATKTTTVTL